MSVPTPATLLGHDSVIFAGATFINYCQVKIINSNSFSPKRLHTSKIEDEFE